MAYRPLALGGQIEDLGAAEDILAQSIRAAQAKDARKKAMLDLALDQQKQKSNEIDLARDQLVQDELVRTTGEEERGRDVRRRYQTDSNARDTIPLGVINPRLLDKQEVMGPMVMPSMRTGNLERETQMDLAAINPDMADKFRLGRQGEIQGAEDRARKIGFETADEGRKVEDQRNENTKISDAQKQQIIANNLAWFQANTGRMNANNSGMKKPGRPIPAAAQSATLENIQNAKKAQKAYALLSGKAVGNMKGDKSSTGLLKGMASTFGMGTWLDAINPSGVPTRAAIADLGSMVIHERSGAAVTASESPRLRPFIPSTYDSPATAKTKLKRFIQEYNSIVADQAQQYGTEAGYAESPLVTEYLKNAPSAIFDSEDEAKAAKAAGTLIPGTVILVDGEEVEVD